MINQQQQTPVTNQQSAQQKQQLAVQKQFAMRKQQMDKAKMQAKQQGKLPVNAESLDAKIASLVSAKISTLSERADFWHPDPAQDRKLGGPGANQRAREDGAATSKSPSKSDNKLRPGESYMQYAKRKAAERNQKEEYGGGMKKGGSYAKGYAAMQKQVEKLDKGEEPATAKRYKEMKKEEFELDEVTSADYTALAKTKKPRSKESIQARYHAKRLSNPERETGKKSPRPYYPGGRKGMTQKDRDWSRGADEYGHSGYDGEGGGGSLPKGKKLTRQKATGVSESRRMDREGVERGGSDLDKSIRAGTKERAAKAVEAVKKGDKRVEKYVKKYGTTPSKDTLERRNLKMMHPGSRQEPKVKGEKETAQQTHNRRVNRHNERLIKHGSTAKEKKSAAGYAEYEKQYKSQYGQHKSAWD